MNRDSPHRLVIIAADNTLCNRLLSGLRRDGMTVTAKVMPAWDARLSASRCDLLLLVEAGKAGAAAVIAQYRAADPDFPLLVATTGRNGAVHPACICDMVPAADLPRLQRTVRLNLCLQRERRRARRLERQLRTLEEGRQGLLAKSPLAIAFLAGDRHLYCNAGYAALFGEADPGALTGTSLLDLVTDEERVRLEQLLDSGLHDRRTLTVKCRGQDGVISLRLAFSPSLFEGRACLQVEAVPARNDGQGDGDDDPEGKDLLTRLDNLPCFNSRVESAITAAVNDGITSVLAVIRIDQFRRVQETIGKAATLEVLSEIGDFLRNAISKPFTATRLARDEFGILVYRCEAGEGLRLADYIHSRVNDSLLPQSAGDLTLRTSIGLAVVNHRARNAGDMISRARMNTGTSLSDAGTGKADMAESIRRALDDNRPDIQYQPVVPFQADGIERFEAGIRLQDSRGERIPADKLRACANMHNLGEELDRQLLAALIAQAHHGQHTKRVFQVPLSSNSLAGQDLPGWLGAELRKHKVAPDCLQCLVSETDLHSNREQVMRCCAALEELGIGRVITCFGSAVEPLTALAAVKPLGVRLDPPLTRDLLYSRQQQYTLTRLINAVHHEGITVTVTDLIDDEMLPLLFEMGVDLIQGNCLQPPREEPVFAFPETQVITLPL